MKPLLAYLPIDRLHALAQGMNLPESCQGSALFADISGFTPLAEGLMARFGAQRAAEELARLLDQVYLALIDQVHSFHGSVIGFVGDAITCWFDETDLTGLQKPVRSVLRAAACALAMQREMAAFADISILPGAPTALAIKIGLASGPARRFLVGDPAIQVIDTLAGDTLRQMSEAEGVAHKSEIVLSPSCTALLGESITILERRLHPESGLEYAVLGTLSLPVERCPWPPMPPETSSNVETRSWLLPLLYEKLSGGDTAQPELRPAVSLFLHFSGIDYEGDENAGLKLDAYIKQVQQIVHLYAGSLIQLTIGDKGSFLYAAFGAPLAHDDDTLRAVRAASELLKLDQPEGIIAQVGIARGQARTGAYGSYARCSYGVIGDDAVLACRLMAAAPAGEMRCAFSVYRELQSKLAFESLPPVRVKGRSELIRVYRPIDTDQLPVAHDQPEMVGRRDEIAELERLLDAVQGGAANVLVIEGEAGIGKSRLVDELVRLMRAHGLARLLGAGQSIEQQTPYRAWRDVFYAFFGLENILDAADRRERVQSLAAQLAPDHSHLFPLLDDMLHLGLPDNDITRMLEPRMRQQSLAVLLTDLLRAWASAQPLVIVLEDAHWLDDLSWLLAEQIARALRVYGLPLLLVIVNRPLEEESPGFSSLTRLTANDNCNTLRLGALHPGEIATLAANRLEVEPGQLPKPFLDLVQARSGGNPFFAEELVFALRDQGILQVSAADGVPRVQIIGDLNRASQSLPDTLHGLILSRIDRLSPPLQITLKVASVIGRIFALTPLHYTLSQYAPALPSGVRAQMQTLSEADFTFVETVEPDLAYAFKHIITQEAAYQTLLFAQRRELHTIVASWYEAQPDQAAYFPLLVHHYRQAEATEKECHFAGLAGEQAARQYANESAVRYFSRALELTPEANLEEQYRLSLGREAVYEVTGERDNQAADLRQLADLSDRMADIKKQAAVSLRLAIYERLLDNPEAALEAARRAVSLAEQANDLDTRIGGLNEWGRILAKQCQYHAAQAQLEQSLRLARAEKRPRQEAQNLYDLGGIAYQQADYAAARGYYDQAQTLYQAIDDQPGQMKCLLMFGLLHYTSGEYIAAQGKYELALAISQTIGWRYSEANILTNLGNNWFDLGNYLEARRYHEQSLSISREIGYRENEAINLDTLGLIHSFQQDYATAVSYGRQALALQWTIDDPYSQGYTWNHLGVAYSGANDFIQAAEAFTAALKLRRELGQPDLAMDDLAGLARVALGGGDLPKAREHAEIILTWLAEHDADGIEFPVWVFLTVYRVLTDGSETAQMERARQVLADGYALMMVRANAIRDEPLRQQFLENVPFNCELRAAHN